MRRAMILGLVIGCAPMPVEPNPAQPAAPPGHYVAASLETVSRRAQNLLQSLDLTVAATPDGDTVRLRCTTKRNGHFNLILTQANTAKTPEGERTVVRLDWEDGTDEALGIRVLAGLGILEGL